MDGQQINSARCRYHRYTHTYNVELYECAVEKYAKLKPTEMLLSCACPFFLFAPTIGTCYCQRMIVFNIPSFQFNFHSVNTIKN